jgi:hypothetical protein
MFIKRLTLRAFWIVLLVVSSLWLARLLLPTVYSLLHPAADFQQVIRALEMRGPVPSALATSLPQFITTTGTLQRAVQISYHTEFTATLQLNASHSERTTEQIYFTRFEKVPKAQILVIDLAYRDGVLNHYSVQLHDTAGLITYLAGEFFPPLLLIIFSIYMLRGKPLALFDDPEMPKNSPES